MKPSIFITGLLVLNALAANAQTNFSGTWIFKDQQSISGNMYSNGVPKQLSITQTEKTVIIQRVTAGADGTDVIANDTLRFDGKPFKSLTSSKRNKETTIKWSDPKEKFTTIATAFNADDKSKADFKTTDVYSIENDQLVLTRKSENFTNGEVWETKGIYDKQ